ncbi:MAG: cytochrome P460 family protein [Longimicrobiales bacterium]
MLTSRTLFAQPLLLACGLAACGAEEEPDFEELPAVPAAEQAAPPDTTAEALWQHLQQANYREAWQLWPGKGELYAGTEPHGMLLTTYTNTVAELGLPDLQGTLPAGAIVVKENYMPDSTLAALTVMLKAPGGYDPANNDWFWVKYNPDGTVADDAAGRAPMCAACHSQAAQQDYLITAMQQRTGAEMPPVPGAEMPPVPGAHPTDTAQRR